MGLEARAASVHGADVPSCIIAEPCHVWWKEACQAIPVHIQPIRQIVKLRVGTKVEP